MKYKITYLFLILFSSYNFSQQQVDIPWPSLADSPWPMVAHDPQITGRSPYSGPKTPTIKWSIDLPFGVYSGPIIGKDGTLYVGTRAYLGFVGDTTNYFYAIDPKEGKIKWTFLTGTPFANESGYLINNEGTIFFGSQSGWLYAIDTVGSLKWKYNTGGNIHQGVMNTDIQGNIYIANNTGYLYSFSKDGQLNWKVNYGGGLFPKSVSIAPDGRTIYVPAKNDSIYALNLSGIIVNAFSYSNNIVDRQPLLIDNSENIYLLARYQATGGGALISFNSAGNINWLYVIDYSNPGFTDSSPAMDYEGNIYYTYSVDSGSSWFSRIESVDYYGNYRWTYQFDQPREYIMMPLVVDKDGTIYCGSSEGYNYYAVSKDGELLWQISLDGYYVENATAIGADGTLYIGKNRGSIFTQGQNTLVAIQDTGVVSVNDINTNINDYYLLQNYPNPFNPNTKIDYAVKETGVVQIKVYDILGKEVAVLENEEKIAGYYSVIFDGNNLPSGVYVYSLRVNGFTNNKKMLLLK